MKQQHVEQYVVHIFETQSRHTFRMHKPAFQAFKAASRKKLTVALWHCGKNGTWTIVHHTGFYPTAMTQPPYDSDKGVA
jgi:hypothetical protein